MSKEMDFFIYLLEHYAESKGVSANEALREWDERIRGHRRHADNR